jgi:hypothetical protein
MRTLRVVAGARNNATGDTGLLSEGRLLLCDRHPKWSSAVERWLGTAWCASRADAAQRAEL